MDDFLEFLITIFIIFLFCSLLGLALSGASSESFGRECRVNGGAPMSTESGDRCVYPSIDLKLSK